ncbi:hypothetical protein R1sor_010667 [Riccia sorocarpa]|uniref:Uncharacterized protein n=1 Tax=Riccia sorocarpa TaxID=122646 RepID=A0ABD3I042_9MARC
MASGSRKDKRKAPMILEEDIGTEEGELVDQDPLCPEAVVRSARDRKRKQIAVEEGLPAVALRPILDNRTEAQRKQAIKDERYRQNSLFRHRWFQWFTQETANRTPIEQKFFSPGSKKRVANFRSHLMELAVEMFLKEKDTRILDRGKQVYRRSMKNEEEQAKWRNIAQMWVRWFAPKKTITDFGSTSGKYKLCESVSDNTIRFISPKDSFTRMDETARLGSGGKGLTHRVGIIDEELAEVLGHHEVVHYALKVMHRRAGDNKVHEKCIREMMAFPESHPAIIRPIGFCKDKKKSMLLFPLRNGRTIEKCMNLEKSTRGRISPEGDRRRKTRRCRVVDRLGVKM